MRHMETYIGHGVFLEELKKEGPSLKTQLNTMRAKVLKEAQAFEKKKTKTSKILTNDVVKVDLAYEQF